MTTSGLTTGAPTARDVIKAALQQLGEYSALQEPDAADEQLGRESLNWMLKDWQNDGLHLWQATDYDITWPANTSQLDIIGDADQTGILDIIDLRFVESATNERQLQRWESSDYASLPNKAQSGSPTVYMVGPSPVPGSYGLRLRVWPCPTTSTTLRGTVNRVIEDVTDEDETLDLPQAYTRTAIMCLAAYLAPSFPSSSPERLMVLEEAKRLYRIMRAADRPASYFFEGATRYG